MIESSCKESIHDDFTDFTITVWGSRFVASLTSCRIGLRRIEVLFYAHYASNGWTFRHMSNSGGVRC